MDKGWIQFLLVAVPVLSLVGSWLALRTLDGSKRRPPKTSGQAARHDEAEKP